MFSEDMGPPFTILHSVSHVQDKVHTLEVLLLRIQNDPEETKGSGYSVFLEWITVANTAEQGDSCSDWHLVVDHQIMCMSQYLIVMFIFTQLQKRNEKSCFQLKGINSRLDECPEHCQQWFLLTLLTAQKGLADKSKIKKTSFWQRHPHLVICGYRFIFW